MPVLRRERTIRRMRHNVDPQELSAAVGEPSAAWPDEGSLANQISTTVVQALARTTGRGPTRAKTTLGVNGVFVVLQDTLTRGEQTLVDAGESAAVLDLRRRWQRVMQEDVSREIERLTGRNVIGFMSDNHIDPDLAVEVFILEPRRSGGDA